MSKQYMTDSFPLWHFKEGISIAVVPNAFQIFCEGECDDVVFVLTDNPSLWEYLQTLGVEGVEYRYTDELDVTKGGGLYVINLDRPEPQWWLILL